MAHHKATQKSIRKNVKRTELNRARKTRYRNAIKQTLQAVESGSKDEANQALKSVQSALGRAQARDIIKKNTASRILSRLNARIKSLAA